MLSAIRPTSPSAAGEGTVMAASPSYIHLHGPCAAESLSAVTDPHIPEREMAGS